MKNKLNERKQNNRNAQQSGNAGSGGSEDAGRTRKPKRPLSWDARDIKTYSGLSGSTGRFTERFFEQEED